MKKMIEFQQSKNDMSSLWPGAKASSYEDLILVDSHKKYRHRFEAGKTKIRILPPLKGHKHWMFGIKAIQTPAGRHASPRTLDPSALGVFDIAYNYLNKKHPGRLFRRSNKKGFRLLPAPLALCWAVIEDTNGLRLRLLCHSLYDGSRGGSPGLGYMIYDRVRGAGEDVNQPGHPLNPHDGRSLTVERIGGSDAKFPSYRVNLSDERSTLQSLMDKVTDIEFNAFCPLQETIRIMDPEQEWRLLANLVGEDLVSEIRLNQEKPEPEEFSETSVDDDDVPENWEL